MAKLYFSSNSLNSSLDTLWCPEPNIGNHSFNKPFLFSCVLLEKLSHSLTLLTQKNHNLQQVSVWFVFIGSGVLKKFSGCSKSNQWQLFTHQDTTETVISDRHHNHSSSDPLFPSLFNVWMELLIPVVFSHRQWPTFTGLNDRCHVSWHWSTPLLQPLFVAAIQQYLRYVE